jgi:hypothetical protein
MSQHLPPPDGLLSLGRKLISVQRKEPIKSHLMVANQTVIRIRHSRGHMDEAFPMYGANNSQIGLLFSTIKLSSFKEFRVA